MTTMARVPVILFLGILFWAAVTSLIFLQISRIRLQDAVNKQANALVQDVRSQVYSNEEVLDRLKLWRKALREATYTREVIAVLVLACNRVSVRRTLDQLLRYRPAGGWFPIIVSQDGYHKETAAVLRDYKDRNGFEFIQQPDQSKLAANVKSVFNIEGYHRISRHYKWALSMAFDYYNHSAAIIVEDDLDVSMDFFEYFSSTLPILRQDPSVFCISAYNDNGKLEHISSSPDMLHRTDFFPGLGWLLTRELWNELKFRWPKVFWDDWIRQPQQRKGRACIRPEISRSRTFGRAGVSEGQFFDKYLRDIHLNRVFVHFRRMDLTYLLQQRYDRNFRKTVLESHPYLLEDLLAGYVNDSPIKVIYYNQTHFSTIAVAIGIMDDFKSGVPRTGYKGIVSISHKGVRVFIAPEFVQTLTNDG